MERIEILNLLPTVLSGMAKDDPVYRELERIIRSPEGRKAMIAATTAGLPALAGVEPMIVASLGPLYGPHDQGTVSAGGIIGEVMRPMGYRKDRDSAPMPIGSVAQSAATWIANSI
ncbi:hypothetical protein [Aureimonas sp. AU4]|uniref:hypothetical protein n=1 Tax=Aureimonas sp. AU4 TaxID=1638163 RepID=UPI0012E3EA6D|nr:hypothetical protein [Aureimonas sp. AU4]